MESAPGQSPARRGAQADTGTANREEGGPVLLTNLNSPMRTSSSPTMEELVVASLRCLGGKAEYRDLWVHVVMEAAYNRLPPYPLEIELLHKAVSQALATSPIIGRVEDDPECDWVLLGAAGGSEQP